MYGLLFFLVVLAGGVEAKEDENRLLMKGDAFLKSPLYDSAFMAYSAALDEAVTVKDLRKEAWALIRLGTVDNIFTRSRDAIDKLNRAKGLLMLSGGPVNGELADCEQQLSRAYEDIGDIEESGRRIRTALVLKRALYGERDARTAYAYMQLARYHSFKKENDSAWYYSSRAYEICRSHPEHRADIRYPELLLQHAYDTKNGDPLFLTDRNRHYRNVRALYRDAEKCIRETYQEPSTEEAAFYQGIANTYNDELRGAFDRSRKEGTSHFIMASQYYDKAIRIKEKLYGKYHRSVAVSYYTKALIYQFHPDLSFNLKALDVFQMAISALFPGFRPVSNLSLPTGLECSHPYQACVIIGQKNYLIDSLYNKTGDSRYLWAMHEHNKFRIALWDEIIGNFESTSSGETIHIWGNTAYEDAMKTAFLLFRFTNDSSILDDFFTISERGRNNDFAEQEIREGRKVKGSRMTNRSFHAGFSCVKREDFMKQLPDERTAFISLSPGSGYMGNNGFGFALTRNRYIVKEIPVRDKVTNLILQLDSSILQNNPGAYVQPATGLYRLLLFPFLSELDTTIDKIILSVNGSLARIPFDALLLPAPEENVHDFRKLPYLIRRYSISYALSASSLSRRLSLHTGQPVIINFFIPDFTQQSALPFSRAGAEKTSEKYHSRLFTGKEADVERFLNPESRTGILHIATHALNDESVPGSSFLLFSGKQGDERFLLDNLYRLRMHNPLTIISACESGKGKNLYAEGSRSFSRAFLFTGSESTISTLWKSDDRSTSEILQIFYDFLSMGKPRSVALSEAKNTYLDKCRTSDGANPLYWSGLILTGNFHPLKPEPRSSFHLLPVGIAVSLLMSVTAYFIYKQRLRKRKSSVISD